MLGFGARSHWFQEQKRWLELKCTGRMQSFTAKLSGVCNGQLSQTQKAIIDELNMCLNVCDFLLVLLNLASQGALPVCAYAAGFIDGHFRIESQAYADKEAAGVCDLSLHVNPAANVLQDSQLLLVLLQSGVLISTPSETSSFVWSTLDSA